MKIRAIIFDMDGVLVNSEPVILAASIAGLKEFGVNAVPEDFTPFIGAGEDRFVGGPAEKHGVPYKPEMKKRVYEIYVDIVEENLKVYDGVRDLLVRLQKEGFLTALASSADHIKVDANLRVAGIEKALFRAIITGEDVARKKPFPDIYLLAGEKIGAQPAECLVVEDAINGIQAARAAGMRCCGITTSFSREILEREKPDLIVKSINDVYQSGFNLL